MLADRLRPAGGRTSRDLPSGRSPATARRLAAAHAARRVVTAIAAGAVTGLVLSGMAVAPAGATPRVVAADGPFVPVAGPVFGDPTAGHNAILARLLANIAHTPTGATIQIVGYSFSLGSVATALLNAYRRGVNVQVVMDGHSRSWSPAKRLVPVLGTDASRGSFFLLTRGSARGTGGVTHQKSWTFSQVGETRDVVMVGSSNLTGYGMQVQYSDNYVFTGRADVYATYAAVFQVQKADVPVADPYLSGGFRNGSAYFFPRPGTNAATDPAALRIAALPADAGTNVRVAQFAWYGPRGVWLAEALARLKRGGATVSVVAGESVGGNVRAVLAGVGIPVYAGVYPNGTRIHTKLMLASYRTSTGTHQSIWTGSDNWADESFRNDDDVLDIDDDVAGYRRYVRFVNLLAYPAGRGAAPPPVVVQPPRHVTSVGVRLSHVRVHRQHRLVVSGAVRPDYAGRRVLVQRHRYRAAGWHTVVTSQPLSTSAAYRIRVPTGQVGRWRYRVLVRATRTATTGRSRVVALRVLR